MKATPLLLILMTVGCGPLVTEPMPDIPETVEYDTVRITYDEEARDQRAGLEKREHPLVGDMSLGAALTRGATRSTNILTALPFVIIDITRQTSPTEFSETRWVWENRSVQNGERPYRVELTELNGPSNDDNGSYAFTIFSAETATSDFIIVADGEYTLFERAEDGAQQGFGQVNYDFTAMRQVDKKTNEPTGQMQIGFRSNGNVRQVNVVLIEFDDPKDMNGPQDSEVRYRTFKDTNTGELRFGTLTDFLRDGEPLERFAIHSAWAADRSGRAVGRVDGGSLMINELLLEECWGPDDLITWADLTPDLNIGYEDGVSSDCDPSVVDLDLNPPSSTIPASVTVPSPDPGE